VPHVLARVVLRWGGGTTREGRVLHVLPFLLPVWQGDVGGCVVRTAWWVVLPFCVRVWAKGGIGMCFALFAAHSGERAQGVG